MRECPLAIRRGALKRPDEGGSRSSFERVACGHSVNAGLDAVANMLPSWGHADPAERVTAGGGTGVARPLKRETDAVAA